MKYSIPKYEYKSGGRARKSRSLFANPVGRPKGLTNDLSKIKNKINFTGIESLTFDEANAWIKANPDLRINRGIDPKFTRSSFQTSGQYSYQWSNPSTTPITGNIPSGVYKEPSKIDKEKLKQKELERQQYLNAKQLRNQAMGYDKPREFTIGSQVVKDVKPIVSTALEFTGIPGAIRFSEAPIENITNSGKFITASIANMNPAIGPFALPLSMYNRSFVDPKGAESLFDTVDAFGILSPGLSTLKRPFRLQSSLRPKKRFNLLLQNNIQNTTDELARAANIEELARANKDALNFSLSPHNRLKLEKFRPNENFSVTNQQARFIDDPEAQRLYNNYTIDEPDLKNVSIKEYLGDSEGMYGARDYGDLNDIVLVNQNKPYTADAPSTSVYDSGLHEMTHSRSIRLGAKDAEKEIASKAWNPMIKKNNFGMPEEEAFALQNELRVGKLKDLDGSRVYTEADIPEIKKGLEEMIDDGHPYMRRVNIKDFDMKSLIESLNKIGIGATIPAIIRYNQKERNKLGGRVIPKGQYSYEWSNPKSTPTTGHIPSGHIPSEQAPIRFNKEKIEQAKQQAALIAEKNNTGKGKTYMGYNLPYSPGTLITRDVLPVALNTGVNAAAEVINTPVAAVGELLSGRHDYKAALPSLYRSFQNAAGVESDVNQQRTIGQAIFPNNSYAQMAVDLPIDIATGKIIGNSPKLLTKAGKYLTTKTPLKNAYKYNPWAFKPNLEAYYRGIGEAGYKDAMESGVLRTNRNPDWTSSPGDSPYFFSGKNFEGIKEYEPNVIVEVTNQPMRARTFSRLAGKGDESVFQPIKITGLKFAGKDVVEKLPNIPLSKNTKFYKKDWLRGYKEIPKFKSEIDWAKWNPETPNYPELINEYNAIEESTKKAGTWMKNPDGSKFQGSPEQFIQQQSSWFKKAFGDSKLINSAGGPEIIYHGTKAPLIGDEFNLDYFGRTDKGWLGKGIYTHPDRELAENYAYPLNLVENKYGGLESVPFLPGEAEKLYPNSRVYSLYGYTKNPLKTLKEKNRPLIKKNFGRTSDDGFSEYDAVIDDQFTQEVMFRNPKQVKSAIGNVGFFDMTNPNIYKGLVPAGVVTGMGINELNKKKSGMQKGGTFKSKLTPDQEYTFQQWRKSLPSNLQDDSEDYDLRGAWLTGEQPTYVYDEDINKYQPHLFSNDPSTGRYLKSPRHSSYLEAIENDIKEGYTPYMDVKSGDMYARPAKYQKSGKIKFNPKVTFPDIEHVNEPHPLNMLNEYASNLRKPVKLLNLYKPGVVPIDSEFHQLSEDQKELLRRGNNLDKVRGWYEKYHEEMNPNEKNEELGFKLGLSRYPAKLMLQSLDSEKDNFNEAFKNNKEWFKDWYKKRAELPEFKDIATKRYNILDSQFNPNYSDAVNMGLKSWALEYDDPERLPFPRSFYLGSGNAAFYDRFGNTFYDVNFLPDRNFKDKEGKLQNSLITHEETHLRDHLYPQEGTKYTIGDKDKDWGKGDFIDPIEKIISKEDISREWDAHIKERKNDKIINSFNPYYHYNPTEIRARLNVWRQRNNIDPLKEYTTDEIKSIMDEDSKKEDIDKNIKELYRALQNNPENLKYINKSYVKNTDRNTLPIGKYGRMIFNKPGIVRYKEGGNHGGLDRWFAEKWVDVKTGKPCGRQEGESRRSYPACRPSVRVSSKTPKTSSELSSSEKEKFKRSKTSSQRINYQHRRNK